MLQIFEKNGRQRITVICTNCNHNIRRYIAGNPNFFLFLRCKKCVQTKMKISCKIRRTATPAMRHVTFMHTSTLFGSNVSSENEKLSFSWNGSVNLGFFSALTWLRIFSLFFSLFSSCDFSLSKLSWILKEWVTSNSSSSLPPSTLLWTLLFDNSPK